MLRSRHRSLCLRQPDSEGVDSMTMIGWLVVIVAFVAIELNTMALTTIWFAGGALAAFFAAFAGLSVKTQLVVFLIVSLIMLVFTRPFASKFINKGTVKTNADGLIGKKARVTAEINNQQSVIAGSCCSRRPGVDRKNRR